MEQTSETQLGAICQKVEKLGTLSHETFLHTYKRYNTTAFLLIRPWPARTAHSSYSVVKGAGWVLRLNRSLSSREEAAHQCLRIGAQLVVPWETRVAGGFLLAEPKGNDLPVEAIENEIR